MKEQTLTFWANDGCHLTGSLSSPIGGDDENLHFAEKETEAPGGELESQHPTESRWRSQDANSVCLTTRSEALTPVLSVFPLSISPQFPDRGVTV